MRSLYPTRAGEAKGRLRGRKRRVPPWGLASGACGIGGNVRPWPPARVCGTAACRGRRSVATSHGHFRILNRRWGMAGCDTRCRQGGLILPMSSVLSGMSGRWVFPGGALRRGQNIIRKMRRITIFYRRDAALPEDDRLQYICWPPLIDSVEPVTKSASSEVKNPTPRAMSSGLPSRPVGILATILCRTSSGMARTISVST